MITNLKRAGLHRKPRFLGLAHRKLRFLGLKRKRKDKHGVNIFFSFGTCFGPLLCKQMVLNKNGSAPKIDIYMARKLFFF